MLQANQRYVFFYDFYLNTKPEASEAFLAPISLQQILPHLKARFDSGQCHKIYEKGKAGIRIADIRFDQSKAVILIAYGDTSTADPSFIHLPTGNSRTEHKKRDEAGAFSAHVVIKMQPSSGRPHTVPNRVSPYPC